MSDELQNAATIASLRAEVERLKAELADMTKNRDECAAVFWIDRDHQTRGPVDQCGCPSCVLHLVYRDKNAKELADRNAYAERLLAENVRLSNEAAELREDLANAQTWIDGQDVRSDFPNATAMRQALDTARERVREWNVLVAQGCTPGGSEFHDTPQNVARYIKERTEDKDRIIKSQQRELNKARERAGVLEAEVRAWHAAEHLRKDEPHNEFMRLAEARARTRDTHALDAAKFGGAK